MMRLLKKSESGRSLTEMLGVLAVIGVMSIAGIIGYRYAITKERADATLAELNLRAVSYSQQAMAGLPKLTSDDLGDETQYGYGVSAKVIVDDPEFMEIVLKEVPKAVCEKILLMDWQLPVAVYVNDKHFDTWEGGVCGTKNATMIFEMHANLTPCSSNCAMGSGNFDYQ